MELSKNRRQTIYERALREQETTQAAHVILMNNHIDVTRRCADTYHRVEEAQNDLDTFGELDELLEAYEEADSAWRQALDVFDDTVGDSLNIVKGKMEMTAVAYEAYIA
jgi:hypothetical protein